MDAVARRVVELLDVPTTERLVSAQELAAQLGVNPSWVYAHAGELGAVRLGRGPKAPLRFRVSDVLAALEAEPLPSLPAAPRRHRKGLLPIRGQ